MADAKFARGIFDLKHDVPKLATGGACLFALGSLIPLLWLISQGGDGSVFQGTAGGGGHAIPLLTYSGWAGMLLLLGEGFAIAGAFIFTAAPRLVPLKWQRIGHSVLVGWSLLWALGTWRLAVIDPGFWTLHAIFFSVLSACTAWRAWRNWSPKDAQSMASFLMPSTSESQPDNNYFANAPAPSAESERRQIAAALLRARGAAVAASRKVMAGLKAGIEAARRSSAPTNRADANSRAATPPRG